ncbi:hypothetical protein L7H23_04080 [Sphingopyxis sp. BSN-002]|uniref:hypothetical protein n=1 Tax=Sphingopyxis sp. BSN-002 TaxID=2911495 RepID=UPI001EDB8200|nr:hypothetical protein [Sphingopyxis sp. BSN-002]UKK85298.1 hypothetical protein L7H23_04080 [Sphingopyxis sp. BSN-002]
MRGWILALAVIAGSVPAAAQTINMPIAKGFWIAATGKCATATNGYAYDGARWGAVYFYGPNASMGPVAEMEKIGRTNPVPGGFTNMQLGDYQGMGYFHLKAVAAGKAVLRTGAPGPEGVQVMDDAIVVCDLKSLSPRMQAALKRLAPALAVK